MESKNVQSSMPVMNNESFQIKNDGCHYSSDPSCDLVAYGDHYQRLENGRLRDRALTTDSHGHKVHVNKSKSRYVKYCARGCALVGTGISAGATFLVFASAANGSSLGTISEYAAGIVGGMLLSTLSSIANGCARTSEVAFNPDNPDHDHGDNRDSSCMKGLKEGSKWCCVTTIGGPILGFLGFFAVAGG